MNIFLYMLTSKVLGKLGSWAVAWPGAVVEAIKPPVARRDERWEQRRQAVDHA